jgi:hypothetical protein
LLFALSFRSLRSTLFSFSLFSIWNAKPVPLEGGESGGQEKEKAISVLVPWRMGREKENGQGELHCCNGGIARFATLPRAMVTERRVVLIHSKPSL